MGAHLTPRCTACHSRFMSNGIAFSDRQVEQLTELLHAQRESTVDELKAYVGQRLDETTTELKSGLTSELKAYIDQRFIDERSVIKQIVQAELREIRTLLEKLETRVENDAKDTLLEVEALKRRLVLAEADIIALKTA